MGSLFRFTRRRSSAECIFHHRITSSAAPRARRPARTRLRGPKECSTRQKIRRATRSLFRFALLFLRLHSKRSIHSLASQRASAAPRRPSADRSDGVSQRGSAQCIACRPLGSEAVNRATLFGENRRSRHAMRRRDRTDAEQRRRGSRNESGSTRTPVIALFFVQKSYKINRAVEKRSNIVKIIKQNEEPHTRASSAQPQRGITVKCTQTKRSLAHTTRAASRGNANHFVLVTARRGVRVSRLPPRCHRRYCSFFLHNIRRCARRPPRLPRLRRCARSARLLFCVHESGRRADMRTTVRLCIS